jgi:hypothetical protein
LDADNGDVVDFFVFDDEEEDDEEEDDDVSLGDPHRLAKLVWFVGTLLEVFRVNLEEASLLLGRLKVFGKEEGISSVSSYILPMT